MSLKFTLEGDWEKSKDYFTKLSKRLKPAFIAHFTEDGQYVLEKLRGHIYNQDLGWTPLSPHTVELKGGDTTILIDTGTLVNGLQVKKVSGVGKDLTLYIGAFGTASSGDASMKDLMIWIEYGTDKMPARPLIRPTYEEVQSLLEKGWIKLFQELIKI